MSHLKAVCSQCGKIKQTQALSYCLSCFEKEREDYRKIRRYLQKHPHANALELAQKTDVEVERILQYIKEKTFLLKKDS